MTEPSTNVIEQPSEPTEETQHRTPTGPIYFFIIADDLGVDAVPRYPFGEEKPHMPTLRTTYGRRIRFSNVWTNPVCSPTRAAILTGKYGYRTGVLNTKDAGRINPNEQTIHRSLNELSDSPYQTSIIGKWHLSARNSRMFLKKWE